MSTIVWNGISELKAKLKDMSKMEAAKKIVKMNGAEMQQNAQRFAPVDTGQLKRSIMLDITDNGMTARTEATVNYAAYVEYGTRYMAAQSYMRPAFNIQKATFINDLQNLTK